MKKLFALLVVLCLTLGCCAAFATTDSIVTAPGELPVVSEPLTLSLGMMANTNITSYAYGENFLTTFMEDLTGIHLDINLYPSVSDDAYAKLRLQINGGEELNDILYGFDLGNDAVRESYGQAGAIIPLNDYIGTLDYYHAQALAKTEAGADYYWNMGKSLDGNYYGMLSLYYTLPNFYSMRAWINRDFVEALGMEMPEGVPTQEWWVNYLRGVRDNDVNGNGDPSDEIPMIGGTGWHQNLIKWTMKQYTYVDDSDSFFSTIEDGQLSYAYTKEEFREALSFVASLYDEGLFPDYALTEDNSNYNALIAQETPIVGFGVSGSCAGFGANMPSMDPMPVVAGPDGYVSASYFAQNPNFATCITSDCEHPEAAFRMFDAMTSEQEYGLYFRWGEPGVNWEWPADDAQGMYEAMGLSAYFTQLESCWGVPSTAMWGNDSMFGTVDWENINSRFSWDGNEANNEYKNALAVTKQVDYAPAADEVVGKIVYSVDEQEEWANTRTAIKDYVNQFMAQAATGQIDIDDDAVWAEFQAQVEGLGCYDLLAMDQAAYNRTMGIE